MQRMETVKTKQASGMKTKRRACMLAAALFVCVLLSSLASLGAQATDPTNFLAIKVGYSGGPYVDKCEFSTAEIVATLPEVNAVYTFGTVIREEEANQNGTGTVPVAAARGVELRPLLEDMANIDLAQVLDLAFTTGDKGAGHTTLSPDYLFQPRYYYPHLPANYDFATKSVPENLMAKARSEAEQTPTILAVSAEFRRLIDTQEVTQGLNADTGKYYPSEAFKSMMKDDECLRLFFGQAYGDLTTNTTYDSAKWVKEIRVTYAGFPVLSIAGESEVSAAVGSKYQFGVDAQVVDEALKSAVDEAVTWYSEDEDVATVDQNGVVTVKGEGVAVIVAQYPGGEPMRFVVNGQAKEEDDSEDSNPNKGGNKNPNDDSSGSSSEPDDDPKPKKKKEKPDDSSSSEPDASEPNNTAGGDGNTGTGGPDGTGSGDNNLSQGDVYSVTLGKDMNKLADAMGQVLGPVEAAGSTSGGVKWKMYELSDAETIVPEIDIETSPYTKATIAVTASLFGIGAVGTILRFYWLK